MNSVTMQKVLCLTFNCVMFASICVQATTVDFHPTTAGSSRCVHTICAHTCLACHVSPPSQILTLWGSKQHASPFPPSLHHTHTYNRPIVSLYLWFLNHCINPISTRGSSQMLSEGLKCWQAGRPEVPFLSAAYTDAPSHTPWIGGDA